MTLALGEFELIRRFFTRQSVKRMGTLLGVGDDCALVRPGPQADLAVTVDTLVEGVHFLPGTDPERLGHKALAVNLSDLAATGAEPAWATLALTLPQAEESWLTGFAKGFLGLAERYGVELIGGDTTRGPLSITVQAMGLVQAGKALRRSTARVGDRVYLTGELGAAGLGLKILLRKTDIEAPEAVAHLEQPDPRVLVGLALIGVANACIDVSDGLTADLGHILKMSNVGATLKWSHLPLSASVRRYVEANDDWSMPLQAGDDYELCFTVAPECEGELERRMATLNCPCARIGRIESQPGLRLEKDGQILDLTAIGYQHFFPAV